jgi:4-hydroxy-3-methylbut-2-enyl diphosphate reductase
MVTDTMKRLVLIQPRGFCAGVVRAIDAVWLALERFGPPIYVRHEIVHNDHVLAELEAAGAVFVDELDEVPPESHVFFSAHGVSPAVRDEAARRNLKAIDATCPLVAKVHQQAIRLDRAGYTIILIGHREHVEVVGTRGEAEASTVLVSTVAEAEAVELPDPQRVAYLTQTTLSVDDVAEIVATLERRFPAIRPPASEDICYATSNRQAAVRAVAPSVDVMLVVGSPGSSNSRSLVATAERAGAAAALVPAPPAIPWPMLEGASRIGLTSGASTPDGLFQEVVEELVSAGFGRRDEIQVLDEHVTFATVPALATSPTRRPR